MEAAPSPTASWTLWCKKASHGVWLQASGSLSHPPTASIMGFPCNWERIFTKGLSPLVVPTFHVPFISAAFVSLKPVSLSLLNSKDSIAFPDQMLPQINTTGHVTVRPPLLVPTSLPVTFLNVTATTIKSNFWKRSFILAYGPCRWVSSSCQNRKARHFFFTLFKHKESKQEVWRGFKMSVKYFPCNHHKWCHHLGTQSSNTWDISVSVLGYSGRSLGDELRPFWQRDSASLDCMSNSCPQAYLSIVTHKVCFFFSQ